MRLVFTSDPRSRNGYGAQTFIGLCIHTIPPAAPGTSGSKRCFPIVHRGQLTAVQVRSPVLIILLPLWNHIRLFMDLLFWRVETVTEVTRGFLHCHCAFYFL